ncbi:MAG: AAA family ATPase [Planctomycetota bacterium]|jgi:energy-coupling factor transporter ATP-binding protein EcfA2
MRVKSISLRNFKGITGTFDLAAFNILLGPNGSGKSAIVEALAWAITGKTSLGGTNEATAKLAGLEGCSVRVVLDDGFKWWRYLDMKPAGITEAGLYVKDTKVGTKAGNTEIVDHCGAFAPMFNLGNFLGQSADRQAAEVMGLCAKAGGEPGAGKSLYVYLVDRLATSRPIAANIEEAIDRVVPTGMRCRPDSLAGVLGRAADLRNAAQAAQKKARATIQDLTNRKQELKGELTTDTLETLQADRAERQHKLGEINQELGNQAGRACGRQAINQRIETLCKQIEAAKQQIATYEQQVVDLSEADRLGAQARALEAEVAGKNASGPWSELAGLMEDLKPYLDLQAPTVSRLLAKIDLLMLRNIGKDAPKEIAEVVELERQAAEIRHHHEGRVAQIKERHDKMLGWAHETASAKEELNALGPAVDTSDLEQTKAMLTAAILKSDALIRARTQYNTLNEQIAAAQADAAQNEELAGIYFEIGRALKKLRSELMADLVKPLVSQLQAVIGPAACGRRVYCTLETAKGRPTLEFGWETDGLGRVSHGAMSGGEKAMFGAAFGIGLATLADPPLKLLLLEAGEIDARSLRKLMHALEGVDWPGNVILATHVNVEVVPDSAWNLIRCGGVGRGKPCLEGAEAELAGVGDWRPAKG